MVGRSENRQRHQDRPQRRQGSQDRVRTESVEAVSREQGIGKVQRRHRGDGQTEAVLAPGGLCAAVHLGQDVDEAELSSTLVCPFREEDGGKKPRRGTAPQREDDEGEHVLDGDRAADDGVLPAREIAVPVAQEGNAEDDVRVVHPGQKSHQPGHMPQDETLRPELDVEMKNPLNGEDLQGMGVSEVEDGIVAGDSFGRECP